MPMTLQPKGNGTMTEYTIVRPDGHLYRGSQGGPDVWRETSEHLARQTLAAVNIFDGGGHRLLRGEKPDARDD